MVAAAVVSRRPPLHQPQPQPQPQPQEQRSDDPRQQQSQTHPVRDDRRRPRRRWFDAVAVGVALLGLYWFAASFFLAKKSLPDKLSDCDDAAVLLRQQLGLSETEVRRALGDPSTGSSSAKSAAPRRRGCWLDRRVDSVVILLVDALRFDFCLYNLPRSVGSRLHQMRMAEAETAEEDGKPHAHNHTRLFRFVADPPTVTMQRLKALTTGGLPTFADISANFGGASVDEDNWVWQQTAVDNAKRGIVSSMPSSSDGGKKQKAVKMGFVGDDTWEDLYPGYFAVSHPYPSFNTRDLDTVDNGCLKHLPSLIDNLRQGGNSNADNVDDDDALEVVVVHFLGVDHVGHTYGPHNEHMDAKLRQMDDALSRVLDKLDASGSCHATLVFGDHGMTEDGNHGGGTDEEVSAALFVHVSPACGELSQTGSLMKRLFEQSSSSSSSSSSSWNNNAPYASINQIDLVPTLSLLLGLPIPYANLGTLVPSLVPGLSRKETATALALNAAQVWRYLSVYSQTANALPNLPQLHQHLTTAASVFQEALANGDGESDQDDDDDRWEQSAALFQHFLAEALALGQRVWTRFDSIGMVCGIVVLAVSGIVYALPLFSSGKDARMGERRFSRQSLLLPSRDQFWEISLAWIFLFFQCGLLTFSNSYILEEEHCAMFFLAILSLAVALRLQGQGVPAALWGSVLLVPVASRLSELFVTGHGLDSSLGVHFAHNAWAFLSSLLALGAFRWYLYHFGVIKARSHAVADCFTLVCLAQSWWEKGNADPDRNGYLTSRLALVLLFLGIPLSSFQALVVVDVKAEEKTDARRRESDMLTVLVKVLIAIVAVTGPSTSTTLLLYTFQITVLYLLSRATGPHRVQSVVLAALLKFVTRHVFFATNHGCAFNRLQYSAAFVATKEFYFATGGISLFLNTFGWETAGLGWALLFSQHGNGSGPGQHRANLWRIYTCLQLLEALASCISVSLLRRHLMVWDIYAPHFLFVAIFTVLNGLCQLTYTLVSAL